jgi:hypothetical protein
VAACGRPLVLLLLGRRRGHLSNWLASGRWAMPPSKLLTGRASSRRLVYAPGLMTGSVYRRHGPFCYHRRLPLEWIPQHATALLVKRFQLENPGWKLSRLVGSIRSSSIKRITTRATKLAVSEALAERFSVGRHYPALSARITEGVSRLNQACQARIIGSRAFLHATLDLSRFRDHSAQSVRREHGCAVWLQRHRQLQPTTASMTRAVPGGGSV